MKLQYFNKSCEIQHDIENTNKKGQEIFLGFIVL